MESGVKTDLAPGFFRRLAAMVYDSFLLVALWFLATALLLPLNGGQAFSSGQVFYAVYLLAVSFGFYGWFWTHGGQTLGLKAWKIKVLTFEQQPLSWKQAFIRFSSAILSLLIGGFGFFWVIWDKNRYAWHDYLSKTKMFFDKVEEEIKQESEEAKRQDEQLNINSDNCTYQEVLGLKENFTEAELKKAYQLAVSRYHPDKYSHMSKIFQEEAQQEFVKIQQAYNVLLKQFN